MSSTSPQMALDRHLQAQLQELQHKGLDKPEHVIHSTQSSQVNVTSGDVINLCANNYLGLADHPALLAAAKDALERWGFGLASVRFICGTQDIHKALEQQVSDFLQTEDCILYSSCFDANAGLFETLLDQRDVIISDQLNHASIIDGVRLCKASRLRYANNDMAELERCLQSASAQQARFKLITTDGVFSMDGFYAKLDEITALAEQYGALVHVDDSHAVGFVGAKGRGSHERAACMDKVDIITGTFGKALGGGSGGYTSGRKSIIDWLRQRSRPYLFSNTMAPAMIAGAAAALELAQQSDELRERLQANTNYFRQAMSDAGFSILPGNHPIVPVMFYDAALAKAYAAELFNHGIYVVAFSFPVVPENQARIRTQLSASHSIAQLDQVVAGFCAVREKFANGDAIKPV